MRRIVPVGSAAPALASCGPKIDDDGFSTDPDFEKRLQQRLRLRAGATDGMS